MTDFDFAGFLDTDNQKDFALSLRSTLESYAKENEISLILRKEQLLLGESGLDITKEILDLFNKS